MIDEKCCRYCMEYVNGVCLNYEVNKMVEVEPLQIVQFVESGRLRQMMDEDSFMTNCSDEIKEEVSDFIYGIQLEDQKFEFSPEDDFYCKYWR